MKVKKSYLDSRICDVETNSNNTETFREFIQKSEKEFGFHPVLLDELSNVQLEAYLNFLDDLWLK